MLQIIFKRLREIMQPLSATEKKRTKLHSLYQKFYNDGVTCLPTHFNNTYFTVIDDDFGGRNIHVSLVNLSQVKVVIKFHEIEYDNTISDRRNAIKTAKDIFDFFVDMRRKEYDQVSKVVQGEHVGPIGLYYSNKATENKVVITATRTYDFVELYFRASEELLHFSRELDHFINLILKDHASGEENVRWDKEVQITKQWWKH